MKMIVNITNNYEGVTEETTGEDLRNYEKLVTLKIKKEYGDDTVVYFASSHQDKTEISGEYDQAEHDEIVKDIESIGGEVWNSESWTEY